MLFVKLTEDIPPRDPIWLNIERVEAIGPHVTEDGGAGTYILFTGENVYPGEDAFSNIERFPRGYFVTESPEEVFALINAAGKEG